MLATIVLTSSVTLLVATILLLALGRRIHRAARIAGVVLAAAVAAGCAALSQWLWGLVPAYVAAGAAIEVLVCVLVVIMVPYWNPVGQVFLGGYATAAGVYLVLAGYLTVASGLSPVGRAASTVLFVLESLALLVSGYFAFEGCDTLCRVRDTRVIPAPDPGTCRRYRSRCPHTTNQPICL